MPTNAQILYLWHLTSGLTHLLLESTYVYNCFTAYITIPSPNPTPSPNPPSSFPYLLSQSQNHLPYPPLNRFSPPRPFLSQPTRLYGSAYSSNIFAQLWMHYARADARYAGIDLTTLSLEIITVFLAGPLGLWVAWRIWDEGLRKGKGGGGEREGKISNATWFWAIVLATGELYGGIMNFLPEALSGWGSLDWRDPVHLWGYVVGCNAVWVFFPVWVLRRGFVGFGGGGEGGKGCRESGEDWRGGKVGS